MKTGWVTKKLADVTTKIGSGATPLGGAEAYKAEGISLIRSLNVYDDGFRKAKLARIDDEQADDLSNVVVEPHDVLLNITGASIARCCLVSVDSLPARVNQHVSIIRPTKEKLDSAFLHYLLISKTYKDRLLHTGEEGGSTRQAITKAQLQEFVVTYPESVPEQQRIVGILDEAFYGLARATANAEQNLRNARALFESHFQAVFTQRGKGWVETTVGAEVDLLSGFPFKSARYTESEIDVRLLRGDNIIQGSLRWDEVKRWPASDTVEYEHYRLCSGDVVLAMDRPWVKAGLKRAQISSEDLPCLLVQRTSRLRGNGNLNNRFLFYLIGSSAFTRHILGVQTGIGVPHISGQQIKEFKFLKPPVKEQVRIAGNLDALAAETQRLESIYQQKLAALGELKKSLLHQAFSGAL